MGREGEIMLICSYYAHGILQSRSEATIAATKRKQIHFHRRATSLAETFGIN